MVSASTASTMEPKNAAETAAAVDVQIMVSRSLLMHS
jgi:hypothetical protein